MKTKQEISINMNENIKLRTILFFLLIGVLQNIFAYPITPRPLRKLVIESEYIVYVDVIKIETCEKVKGWGELKTAVLSVTEVLQGEINNKTIEVLFTPGLSCPAPANYEKGTSVLA